MNNRTGGLIATIVAVVFCGCPGLFLCIWGALASVGSAAGVPLTTELNGVSSQAPVPVWLGPSSICLSLLLLAIPVAVGFFTLRSKPAPVAAAPSAPPPPSAPLPPTS
ncbi:MAG TPA: hypothetical protein VMJ64_05390 [Anaerolineales bacterium]|nr:hypothetical protein [Anaerolineales bacterium]